MTDPTDDADKLRGLRQLLAEQAKRAAEPEASKPGAAAASMAAVEAIGAAADRILAERLTRVDELQARMEAGELTTSEFKAQLAALWGAPENATPQQLLAAMLQWVKRSAPDEATGERIFTDALRKLKPGDEP